jgi:RNA polymerase sigma-70 factor (ECF subfamily)
MGVTESRALPGQIDRLYRAAWALCGDREEAEDLVQETFEGVLARRRTLGSELDLPHLLGTMQSAVRGGARKAIGRPVTAATPEDADTRRTNRPAQALEIQEVYAAIAELPDQYRMAIVAVDVAGLSYREASNALRVSEDIVTSRLYRARRYLTARLSPSQALARVPANAGSERATPSGAPPRNLDVVQPVGTDSET